MKVRIGVGLGVRTALHGPEFGDFVDTVEGLRFDSLWLSERITGQAPDPVVAMSYAAGRTTRLKFGMSVLVLPGRNPVVLAKEMATLADHVRRPAAAGVRPRRRRRPSSTRRSASSARSGRRGSTRRSSVMRACWRGEPVDHDGDRFHYEGLPVRPAAPKRLDVWLGGFAPSELRRVGRLADGWLPSFVTPADAASGRDVIEPVAAEHDRAIEDDHYGVLIPYRDDDGTSPTSSPPACTSRRPDLDDPTEPRAAGLGAPSIDTVSASSTSARRSSSSCRSANRVESWDEHLTAAAEVLLPLET